MLIEGSKILPAPRAEVWQALNDPGFLRATLPDCRELDRTGEDAYAAVLAPSIGPVRASFDVNFRCEDVQPMESYTLVGSGKGGPAGAAQGRVRISLADREGGTLLSYSAETVISGRIAQLGSRMIDGAARRFSEQFFANVQRKLAGGDTQAAPATAGRTPARPAAAGMRDDALRASGGPAGSWWLPVGCALGCFAGTLAARLLLG